MKLVGRFSGGVLTLLRRATGLATDAACCCGGYVCSLVSPGTRQCFRKGDEPNPSPTDQVFRTQADCDYSCPYEWVCSRDDQGGRDCFRYGEEPDPDPNDVKYETEKECRESCEYWVCAWNSQNDPTAGRDCYKYGSEPGLITGYYDSETECRAQCDNYLYVCAWKSNDTTLGKKCYKAGDEPDPSLIIDTYDTIDECYNQCYDGSHSCIIDDQTGDYQCVPENEADGAIVLSNHATRYECELACGRGDYVCAWRSNDPAQGKQCYRVGDEPDPSLIIAYYETEEECRRNCEPQYVCSYKSNDTAAGKKCYELGDEPDPSLIIDTYDSADECYQNCYDGSYSCILDSADDYRCVPTDETGGAEILSNHANLTECGYACGARGSCCIRSKCGCKPSQCRPANSRWEKDDDGNCVEVTRPTPLLDLWYDDGCTVYSVPPDVDMEDCNDSDSGGMPTYTVIGITRQECESDVYAEQPCYDDLTEAECIFMAGSDRFTWTQGERCGGGPERCDCSGWVCEVQKDSSGLVDVGYCEKKYEEYFAVPPPPTKEKCEERCNFATCVKAYDEATNSNTYECTAYDPENTDGKRTIDDCEWTCCDECSPCAVFADGDLPPGSFTECGQYVVSTLYLAPENWHLIESAPESICQVDTGNGIYESVFAAMHDYFTGNFWFGGSAAFAPCYSPAVVFGYLNSSTDANYASVPIPVYDNCDCSGSGPLCAGVGEESCDCEWADYDLALELERRGYKLRVWLDWSIHSETTTDAACYCVSTTTTNYFKARAFVFDCNDNTWKDYTDKLIKRKELKLVSQGVPDFDYPAGNANAACSSQSPDPDSTPSGDLPPKAVFVDPKQPEIKCQKARNPLP